MKKTNIKINKSEKTKVRRQTRILLLWLWSGKNALKINQKILAKKTEFKEKTDRLPEGGRAATPPSGWYLQFQLQLQLQFSVPTSRFFSDFFYVMWIAHICLNCKLHFKASAANWKAAGNKLLIRGLFSWRIRKIWGREARDIENRELLEEIMMTEKLKGNFVEERELYFEFSCKNNW